LSQKYGKPTLRPSETMSVNTCLIPNHYYRVALRPWDRPALSELGVVDHVGALEAHVEVGGDEPGRDRHTC